MYQDGYGNELTNTMQDQNQFPVYNQILLCSILEIPMGVH